jgi:hypothetical protein
MMSCVILDVSFTTYVYTGPNNYYHQINGINYYGSCGFPEANKIPVPLIHMCYK